MLGRNQSGKAITLRCVVAEHGELHNWPLGLLHRSLQEPHRPHWRRWPRFAPLRIQNTWSKS